MPTFQYKARTEKGELREGTIESSSEESALDFLQQNNLVVTSLSLAKGGIFSGMLNTKFTWAGGARQKDIVILSRQLATLFEARIPVVQALRTLTDESSRPAVKKALGEIMNDVTGGMSLSQALAKHPHIFSSFYVNLVVSGEESGKLEDVFTYLADYLERAYLITAKARNALTYPAVVLAAFVIVLTVMLVVVMPRLFEIFKETGRGLPFYTQAIIAISFFVRQWGVAILTLFIIGGVFLWRFALTSRGREKIDKLQLKMPIIGGLYKKLYMARLTDNLKTLILGGIPILRALSITADVVGNSVYKKTLNDALEYVRGGQTISAAFEKNPEIPPLVTQMIRIGETTGKLDFILGSIAKFYQREVDSSVDNLVTLIEPILILLLGGGVAILVASVLGPLYSLVGSL